MLQRIYLLKIRNENNFFRIKILEWQMRVKDTWFFGSKTSCPVLQYFVSTGKNKHRCLHNTDWEKTAENMSDSGYQEQRLMEHSITVLWTGCPIVSTVQSSVYRHPIGSKWQTEATFRKIYESVLWRWGSHDQSLVYWCAERWGKRSKKNPQLFRFMLQLQLTKQGVIFYTYVMSGFLNEYGCF